MTDTVRCYIGLGSNLANALGSPREHVARAIDAFAQSADFTNVVVSSLYRSRAYGVTDQPDFINAVIRAETTLAPLDLLDFCQDLEQAAGRVRVRHWGERSLDVDVLLYGDAIIQNERLTVPHTELFERNFVVIPLLELEQNLTIHGQKLLDLPIATHWDGLSVLAG